MAQYPIPPVDPAQAQGWYQGVRSIDYDPDSPRFGRLPLVTVGRGGTLEVVRGELGPDELVDMTRVLSGRRLPVGKILFVARNRLGEVSLVPVGRNVAGRLEMALYTSVYRGSQRLAEASTAAEVRQCLVEELEYVDALLADGWGFVRYPGPSADGTAVYLVDELRPDVGELSLEELPDPVSMDARQFPK